MGGLGYDDGFSFVEDAGMGFFPVIEPLYNLQDGSSQFWQLGVTPSGQWTTTTVSNVTQTNIILVDSSGQLWQIGVSTSGQLTTTTVSSGTPVSVILAATNGTRWLLGITTLGQITTTQV